MRFTHWKKVAVSAAVVMASVGAGAAWAGQNENPDGQAGAPAPAPADGDRLIGTGINDVKFVPVTPCRLVDTRVPGQRFATNQVRSFDVRGSGASFAAQGGKAGGCDIPGSITAVEITVSAVAAGGSGFLRVYPDAVPTASFLSFNASASSSNTGTVSICGHAGGICLLNNDLRVKAYGASTDVVIDINGYYARPMAGTITAAGGITRASRITKVTKLPTVGTYEVQFDRNVTNCVPQVTSRYYGVIINASHPGVDPNAIFVKTVEDDGVTGRDADFHIEVAC